MSEYSRWLTGTELTMARDLDREFEARLSESSKLAFRVAYGVLRNREDAEDVAQEAMTKAYRSFGRLRERHCFRAWLVRIAWRLAIDHHRSHKRRTTLESVAAAPNGSAEAADDVLAARERSERLWKAIDALPEKLRIVTVLAGIEEHDVHQVSLLLNLPEGTVKSRMFLARQRLKELLQ
jgi:RNA polymerase sigma-70 factor, ECF subfamily